MKLKAQLFLEHLDRASVGGIINEVVMGNHLSFAVTDESKSVVSICKKGISDEDNAEFGIFNIGLFRGAVEYAKNSLFADKDLEFSIVEKHSHQYMMFKKGRRDFSFLISSPKLISSTVDNADDVLSKIGEADPVVVAVTPEIISGARKLIQVIGPAKCTFTVDGS